MTDRPIAYRRNMDHWWRRLPFYRAYLAREASCVFVIAYALVLLAGLASLSQGRTAFDAWRTMLGSPWSIVFHGVLLVAMLYHSWTWFKVMPKTLPFLRIGGRRIDDRIIIGGGLLAALAASMLVFAMARGMLK